MSAEFYEYFRAVFEGVFDLSVGFTVGSVIDYVFARQNLRPVGSREGFMKLLLSVILEASVTITAMLAIRRLMYPNQGQDTLTGGMMFMNALMMSEKDFWRDVEALALYASGALRRSPQAPPPPVESAAST